MKHFLNNWKRLTNDKVILEYITSYKIPINFKINQSKFPKEPNYSKNELKDYDNAIHDLMEKGAIEKCSHNANQFLSPYF